MIKTTRNDLAKYIVFAALGVGLIVFGAWIFSDRLNNVHAETSTAMIMGPISVLLGVVCTSVGIQLSREWVITRRILKKIKEFGEELKCSDCRWFGKSRCRVKTNPSNAAPCKKFELNLHSKYR